MEDSNSFLINANSFEQAATRWAVQVERARRDSGSQLSVQPWLDCPFQLVTNDVCTNVYSCIVSAARRGVLITQWADDAEGNDIEAWIEEFGDPIEPQGRIIYLKINCKATQRSLDVGKRLVQAWLFDSASVETMNILFHNVRVAP